MEVGALAHHEKAVRQARPESRAGDGRRRRARRRPTPIGRAAGANVDRDVEDPAARHPHQLALRVRADLQVQAAQDALRRARMVVLDEARPARRRRRRTPRWLKLSRKKPRASPNTFGSTISTPASVGRRHFHQNTFVSAICSRYWP